MYADPEPLREIVPLEPVHLAWSSLRNSDAVHTEANEELGEGEEEERCGEQGEEEEGAGLLEAKESTGFLVKRHICLYSLQGR